MQLISWIRKKNRYLTLREPLSNSPLRFPRTPSKSGKTLNFEVTREKHKKNGNIPAFFIRHKVFSRLFQEPVGIFGVAVVDKLEMEMRARRISCVASPANNLALFYVLTVTH